MRTTKRAACFLLAVIMLIGILPSVSLAADMPFQDVSGNAWYYDAVSYVSENGIITGTAANQFSPEMEVTRAQMCQILYNMEGKPEINGSAFSDVSNADWFYAAVNWAASVGIVSGVGNGEFAPNTPITREQAMTILYNYASYKGYDITVTASLEGFADASKISAWANTAVQWAVGSGYLSGISQTELQPYGTTTRAQMAMVLMCFSEKQIPNNKPSTVISNTPGISIPSNPPADDETLDEALLKEFKEKDIDDFPGYEILNFDESQETNFAVLQEGTVVTNTSGTTNQLVSRDDENGVFVIENISDDIANLKPGDVLYFSYGSTTDDYLLLKVGEISFDGSTATITADSDTGISDYYEYVDIDMDIQIPGDSDTEEAQLLSVSNKNDDYGDVENAEGKLPITLIDEDSLTVTDLAIVRVTIFYDAKQTWNNDKKVDEINLIRIKLTQKLSVKVSGKYNFLSGKELSKPVNLGYGFDISFSVTPIFEIDTDISASFTVVYEDGFYIDYMKDGKRGEYGQNAYIEDENISSSNRFKCSVGAQATVSLKWTILSIASLNARGTLDLTATGKNDTVAAAKRHDCYTCVSIQTDFTYSIWVDLITINYKKGFKDTFKLIGDTIPLNKYYISRLSENSKLEFGKGECPHYSYLLTITVKDQEKQPLSGVALTISHSGTAIANGTTNRDGEYSNYFPTGTYQIRANLSGFEETSGSVSVQKRGITKSLTLNKKDNDKGDPDEEKPPVENPPEFTGITGAQADIMYVVSGGASYTPCSQAYIIDENNVLWACEHDATNDTGEIENREKHYNLTEMITDVSAFSCGANFVAAIKSDGTLWTWGANDYGQLGNGSYTNSDTPIKVLENVTSVSCGENTAAAITSDGTLWAWGQGVPTSYGENFVEYKSNIPQKVAENIIAVSCHTVVAAINSEHELLIWGDISDGGVSAANYDQKPKKVMDDVVFVDVGGSHIAAIKNDGSLWMWGMNKQGQLGDSTKEYHSDPVRVMDGVTAVSCGLDFTAAVKTDGSLWTWGENYCGHSEGALVPTQITTIGNVTAVNCGSYNSIAVLNDGSVYDWGIAFNMQDWQISAPIMSLTPEKIPNITAKVPDNS